MEMEEEETVLEYCTSVNQISLHHSQNDPQVDTTLHDPARTAVLLLDNIFITLLWLK